MKKMSCGSALGALNTIVSYLPSGSRCVCDSPSVSMTLRFKCLKLLRCGKPLSSTQNITSPQYVTSDRSPCMCMKAQGHGMESMVKMKLTNPRAHWSVKKNPRNPLNDPTDSSAAIISIYVWIWICRV